VVCEIQPGDFYYRGVRLSDGASIELANAVRSSAGFDVTNPSDQTGPSTESGRPASPSPRPMDRHLPSRCLNTHPTEQIATHMTATNEKTADQAADRDRASNDT
jgi:hypothetical protein